MLSRTILVALVALLGLSTGAALATNDHLASLISMERQSASLIPALPATSQLADPSYGGMSASERDAAYGGGSSGGGTVGSGSHGSDPTNNDDGTVKGSGGSTGGGTTGGGTNGGGNTGGTRDDRGGSYNSGYGTGGNNTGGGTGQNGTQPRDTSDADYKDSQQAKEDAETRAVQKRQEYVRQLTQYKSGAATPSQIKNAIDTAASRLSDAINKSYFGDVPSYKPPAQNTNYFHDISSYQPPSIPKPNCGTGCNATQPRDTSDDDYRDSTQQTQDQALRAEIEKAKTVKVDTRTFAIVDDRNLPVVVVNPNDVRIVPASDEVIYSGYVRAYIYDPSAGSSDENLPEYEDDAAAQLEEEARQNVESEEEVPNKATVSFDFAPTTPTVVRTPPSIPQQPSLVDSKSTNAGSAAAKKAAENASKVAAAKAQQSAAGLGGYGDYQQNAGSNSQQPGTEGGTGNGVNVNSQSAESRGTSGYGQAPVPTTKKVAEEDGEKNPQQPQPTKKTTQVAQKPVQQPPGGGSGSGDGAGNQQTTLGTNGASQSGSGSGNGNGTGETDGTDGSNDTNDTTGDQGNGSGNGNGTGEQPTDGSGDENGQNTDADGGTEDGDGNGEGDGINSDGSDNDDEGSGEDDGSDDGDDLSGAEGDDVLFGGTKPLTKLTERIAQLTKPKISSFFQKLFQNEEPSENVEIAPPMTEEEYQEALKEVGPLEGALTALEQPKKKPTQLPQLQLESLPDNDPRKYYRDNAAVGADDPIWKTLHPDLVRDKDRILSEGKIRTGALIAADAVFRHAEKKGVPMHVAVGGGADSHSENHLKGKKGEKVGESLDIAPGGREINKTHVPWTKFKADPVEYAKVGTAAIQLLGGKARIGVPLNKRNGLHLQDTGNQGLHFPSLSWTYGPDTIGAGRGGKRGGFRDQLQKGAFKEQYGTRVAALYAPSIERPVPVVAFADLPDNEKDVPKVIEADAALADKVTEAEAKPTTPDLKEFQLPEYASKVKLKGNETSEPTQETSQEGTPKQEPEGLTADEIVDLLQNKAEEPKTKEQNEPPTMTAEEVINSLKASTPGHTRGIGEVPATTLTKEETAAIGEMPNATLGATKNPALDSSVNPPITIPVISSVVSYLPTPVQKVFQAIGEFAWSMIGYGPETPEPINIDDLKPGDTIPGTDMKIAPEVPEQTAQKQNREIAPTKEDGAAVPDAEVTTDAAVPVVATQPQTKTVTREITETVPSDLSKEVDVIIEDHRAGKINRAAAVDAAKAAAKKAGTELVIDQIEELEKNPKLKVVHRDTLTLGELKPLMTPEQLAQIPTVFGVQVVPDSMKFDIGIAVPKETLAAQVTREVTETVPVDTPVQTLIPAQPEDTPDTDEPEEPESVPDNEPTSEYVPEEVPEPQNPVKKAVKAVATTVKTIFNFIFGNDGGNGTYNQLDVSGTGTSAR